MKVLQRNNHLKLVLDRGTYKIIDNKNKVLFETTSIDLVYDLFQKGA